MCVCVIESHCGLNFHFPVTSDVESCLSSLVKWLCSYFAHLLICFLIVESAKFLNMFYIRVFFFLIWCMIYIHFLLVSGLLFHFLNFFFCIKDVKYDETEFTRLFSPRPPPPTFGFCFWCCIWEIPMYHFTRIIRIFCYFLDGLWCLVLLACL